MHATNQIRPGLEISPEGYERFALGTTGKGWELVDGRLRDRPLMTVGHGRAALELALALYRQLDRDEFRVGHNFPRLKCGERTYLIPDVVVHHDRLPGGVRPEPLALDLQVVPLLFVAEVVCPFAASHYDVDEKVRAYRGRGDQEVWRLDPFERSLIAWRRQPDQTFSEETFDGGIVAPVALSDVTITLEDIFV